MSWIWLNVHKKGKTEEKYIWWFVYLPTRFDKNVLSKLFCSMKNNSDR